MKKHTEYPQGRSLYVSKCSGCHQLFKQNKYDPIQWKAALNQMQKRAVISDFEKEQIYLFLTETNTN